MLVLSRRIGESIVIGDAVVVRVDRLSKTHVALAIDAPREISIARKEVLRREAPGSDASDAPQPCCPPARRAGLAEKRQIPGGREADRASAVVPPPSRPTTSRQDRTPGQERRGNDVPRHNGHCPVLPPGLLDGDGTGVTSLRAAIDCLISDSRACSGPEIEFCDDLVDDDLRPVLRLAVVSIVRELLSNARRHSKSEKILLGLTQDGGQICIQVQDWGVGFDPQNVQPLDRGLKGIRDIAGWLGGTVRIESQQGAGTCVMVEAPLSPEADRGNPWCWQRPR